MSTIQEAPSHATQHRGGLSRFAGMAFAVTYLAAFVLLVSGPNVYEGSIDEYAAAHANDARLNTVGLAAFLVLPLAGAALIWAVAHVSRSLSSPGGASLASRVATAGAAVMASGLMVAGAAALAATHVASGTGGGFPADPAVGYGLDQLSATVMSVSAWGGSLVLLAIGLGARGTGNLPGWLLWTGIVVAPLLPLAYMFAMLPLLVFIVWVAVVPAIVKTGDDSMPDPATS